MKRGPAVTRAMEDYLKALFELGEHDVKPRDLAAAVGVAPASVTGMLDKLASLKLVHYRKYHGASLTPAGRAAALETLRHHRLLETYLAQALGYGWHEVHAEAERLEHVISEEFEARVDALLGHPTHDPHGDPIPQRDGSVPATPGGPLTELEADVPARISRITDQDPGVLAYLADHGLVPGATLRVVDRAPFDGPVTVVLDERRADATADATADAEAAASAAAELTAPEAAPVALAFRMAAAIRAEELG
jgi:DtxR family transcriptional regulator, Mn-dependent transcriptional regulator